MLKIIIIILKLSNLFNKVKEYYKEYIYNAKSIIDIDIDENKPLFKIITEHKTIWAILLVVLTAIWVVFFDIYFKDFGLVSQAMPMDTKEFFVIYGIENYINPILFSISSILILFLIIKFKYLNISYNKKENYIINSIISISYVLDNIKLLHKFYIYLIYGFFIMIIFTLQKYDIFLKEPLIIFIYIYFIFEFIPLLSILLLISINIHYDIALDYILILYILILSILIDFLFIKTPRTKSNLKYFTINFILISITLFSIFYTIDSPIKYISDTNKQKLTINIDYISKYQKYTSFPKIIKDKNSSRLYYVVGYDGDKIYKYDIDNFDCNTSKNLYDNIKDNVVKNHSAEIFQSYKDNTLFNQKRYEELDFNITKISEEVCKK